MKTRIYLVQEKPSAGKPSKLVRAASSSAALRHITDREFDVSIASADDVAEAMAAGARVEEAAAADPADAADAADAAAEA